MPSVAKRDMDSIAEQRYCIKPTYFITLAKHIPYRILAVFILAMPVCPGIPIKFMNIELEKQQWSSVVLRES